MYNEIIDPALPDGCLSSALCFDIFKCLNQVFSVPASFLENEWRKNSGKKYRYFSH